MDESSAGTGSDDLSGRQEILAEFGRVSLKADSLDDILQEACRLVGRGLGTDLAKVMEYRRDRATVMVRAGVGWRPGLVGSMEFPVEDGSSEFEAIRTGMPLVVNDVPNERRHKVADFIREHGVMSLINVPILGPGDAPPFGLLQVDSRTPRTFGRNEISFLSVYANLIASSVERLRLLPALRDAVKAKEQLLRELQHRVKNNLQLITSFVLVQSHRAPTRNARKALETVGQRIETMRLMHAKLYAGDNLEAIDLAPYLREVAEGLVRMHGDEDGDETGSIETRAEMGEVRASVDTAIPLGLIVNEFITNSLKHAFARGAGTIGLRLETTAPGRARLVMWDDGKGLSKAGETGKAGTGMQIIEGLIRQIGASGEWARAGGTSLAIDFTDGSRPDSPIA